MYWGDLSPAEKREFSLLLVETAAIVEEQMQAEVEQFAFGAVEYGASLAQVGRAYGISRQAAAKRSTCETDADPVVSPVSARRDVWVHIPAPTRHRAA